jgi:hypothetical protein
MRCANEEVVTLTLFAFVVAPDDADCTTLVAINGTSYRIVRHVEARSDPDAKWIPILEIERTTPLKQPLTEAEAE